MFPELIILDYSWANWHIQYINQTFYTGTWVITASFGFFLSKEEWQLLAHTIAAKHANNANFSIKLA